MTADTATDLLTGIAEHLHDSGVVNWAGPGVAAATAGALPGLALRQLPPQPAFVVCLFDYRVSAHARLSDATIGVNVRVRSDAGPSKASLVSQQIFLALHAIGRFRFGIGTDHELAVTDVQYQSETQLGPDSGGRHERSTNFYVLLNLPGTTRE